MSSPKVPKGNDGDDDDDDETDEENAESHAQPDAVCGQEKMFIASNVFNFFHTTLSDDTKSVLVMMNLLLLELFCLALVPPAEKQTRKSIALIIS